MKRLLVLLLPLAAHAGDWIAVDNPGGGDRYYYHGVKIVISGDAITYWKKVEFKTMPTVKSRGAKSALFRERMDCAQHTMETLDYLFHSADGTVLEQVSHSDPETQPVIPETIGDLFEQTLCPLVEQRKLEDQEKAEAPAPISVPAPALAPASAPLAAPTLKNQTMQDAAAHGSF